MASTRALQLVDGVTARRVTIRPGASQPESGDAAGALLALQSGAVACNFRIVRERRRSVTCELLVHNGTSQSVGAVAFPQRALEPSEIVPVGALQVPPFSSIAVTLDFPRLRRGAQRVVAAIEADGARLEVEARPLRAGGRQRRSAVVALALVCALAFGLTTLVHGGPHVGSIVNPVTVVAGRPFDVAYSLADARSGRYELTDSRDARVVDSGALPAEGGVLALQVPAAAVASGYDLRIVAENAFGSQARATHFVALATPIHVRRKARPVPKVVPAVPLAIASLAVEHDEVAGGQPIAITYATKATAGSVRLLDQLGTVRAEALLNASGHSILIAPFVRDAQDFRVVVTGERGADRAESTTGLRILDAPPLAGATGGRGWSDAGPISIATAVVPGTAVPVLILRHEHDLRVALVGDDGNEIDAIDVAPEDTRVSLWMPPHTAGRQFTVVVSFVHGTSAETRIVPLRVGAALPHDAG